MRNALLRTDRRHRYDNIVLPIGELTDVTPPTIAERKAKWYTRALNADYEFITGDLYELRRRNYERQEMLDAREPSF